MIIIVLTLGLTTLYIWFLSNAKNLLADFIAEKSQGQLKLEVSKLSFHFLSHKIEIRNALLTSTDKLQSSNAYIVKFRILILRVNSFRSLLNSKQLTLKSIELYDPDIKMVKWREEKADQEKVRPSIARELGTLYTSICHAVSKINLSSVVIDNANISLINKLIPGSRPLVFSNIYFKLQDNRPNRNPPPQNPGNERTIVLRSSAQDISMTDGIHKLVFKKLELQQARKSIELDSCTITALPSKLSSSHFKIFFKKLALVGLGFDTLYKTDLIKADSVYCENPSFLINLHTSLASIILPVQRLTGLETMIKEVSGNLDLGFVGVKNAHIAINITGIKRRSIANSGKDNFQIENLRINPDSSKLVSIRSFNMLVENYHLYNADSSCIYSFDSIRFGNDKLLLSNFSVHTTSSSNKIRDNRDYSMPYFELSGIDWPDLIFSQVVKANEAKLFNPTFNFTKIKSGSSSGKLNLSHTLNTLDGMLFINRLSIINGKFNIRWNKLNFLQLRGLHAGFLAKNLVKNKNDLSLKQSIESLFFSDGHLKVNNITGSLHNVKLGADNHIYAEQLLVNSSLPGIRAEVNGFSINTIDPESSNGSLLLDGMEWKNASIEFSSVPGLITGKKSNGAELRNIYGSHTTLIYKKGLLTSEALVEEIRLSSIKTKNNIIDLNGLEIKGKALYLNDSLFRLSAASFTLSDDHQELSKVKFRYIKAADSLDLDIPLVHVTANINHTISKGIELDDVVLKSPVILFNKHITNAVADNNKSLSTSLKIKRISIAEPVLNLAFFKDTSATSIKLPYTKGSLIYANKFQLGGDGISIESLFLKTSAAEVVNTSGKRLNITDGTVNLYLSKISLPRPGGRPLWNVTVSNLELGTPRGLTFDLKGNTLRLNDLKLGNTLLSSSGISDVTSLINSNKGAWITTSSAEYQTKSGTLNFFNPGYSGDRDLLVLDSFTYRPLMPLDSFIVHSPYQSDYIKFNVGNAKVSGIDISTLLTERKLIVSRAIFNHPVIFVYRDKFQPFLQGIIKPLPVDKIEAIQLPVSIKQVDVKDLAVAYTEKHATARKEGTLRVSDVNGTLKNIRNYDIQSTDSLELVAKGKLMDSVSFALEVNESYADSLNGFRMFLSIEPASLTHFNPLLAPLSNVIFKSGRIDSIYLDAIGKEYLAYGEMKFFYHGLRIRLLKNGDTIKPGFARRIASLLLNTVVIKKRNRERTGLVYFERLRERSFFNYLGKIIFSGVATNIGVKKNSRYRKAYISQQ